MIELLQQALERETAKIPAEKLALARKQLTERYRSESREGGHFMQTEADRLSYLATRMPATFAADLKALQTVQMVKPFSPKSHLDLGAGPGAALWASCSLFPTIETYTAFEQDSHLIELGKKLAQNTPLKKIQWHKQNLESLLDIPPHDLITLSYVIGELEPSRIEPLIERAFKATNELLLIIEPGTPLGFERIRKVRAQLLALGAFPIAPCPHGEACPMAQNDWCHFAARLMRSSHHRKTKEATLNYEDEKFSYFACAKSSAQLPDARILRHPQKHKGHVGLTLCQKDGLAEVTISKKQGPLYKQARDASWGDPW